MLGRRWVAGVVQEAEAGFALEDQRGAAGEWVAKEPVQRKIAARFRRFLLTFTEKEDGQKLYYDAIRDMCAGECPPCPLVWHLSTTCRSVLCAQSVLCHEAAVHHFSVQQAAGSKYESPSQPGFRHRSGSESHGGGGVLRRQQAVAGGELRSHQPKHAHPSGVGGRRTQSDVPDFQPRRCAPTPGKV